MLNDLDAEALGEMFWQIVEYDDYEYGESNNWEPHYNTDKLANALAGELSYNHHYLT